MIALPHTRFTAWLAIFAVCTIGMGSATEAFAQQLPIKRLNEDKGLSQHTVTSMVQDDNGFLWFGTKEGLNRFDAYQFKVYDSEHGNQNSLRNGEINALYKDREGKLWIATTSGLSLYQPFFDNFINYNDGLQFLDINAIYELDDSSLLIGTAVGGLYAFNEDSGSFAEYEQSTFEGNPSLTNGARRIWAFEPWEEGKVLVGTDDGIWVFDPSSGSYRRENSILPPSAKSQFPIRSLLKDADGDLWIGTYGKGLLLRPRAAASTKSFEFDADAEGSISNNFIRGLFQVSNGDIWIGTSSGLNIYHKNKKSFTVQKKAFGGGKELASDRILSFYQDRLGIMWIGTENGINFYDQKQKKFRSKGGEPADDNLLGDNGIRAIYRDSGQGLWLGNSQGLVYLNRQMDRSRKIDIGSMFPRGKQAEAVTALSMDQEGFLWVGTQSMGIVRLKPEISDFETIQSSSTDTSGLSSNNINHIVADGEGAVWVATEGGGLNLWRRKTRRFTPITQEDGLGSNFVSSVAISKKGGVWVSTYGGGVAKVDSRGQVEQLYNSDLNDSTSITSNLVNTVLEGSDGTVWVGTQAGLNSINVGTGLVKNWVIGSSREAYIVKALAEDENGFLWISSNKGLIQLKPASGEVKVYDEKDGLSGNVFYEHSSFKDADGMLFFGGINGFTFFHPSNINDSDYIPPVYLTHLSIDNQNVEVGIEEDMESFSIDTAIWAKGELELDYTQRVVVIEFSALNYRLPEKNRFRYKLEPFQQEWVYKDASRREATYTNLAPGEYMLFLEGSNNDGVWNEGAVRLRISITPPIWDTWWMRAILAAAALGAAFLIYRVRVRRIEKGRKELRRQVKERTQELEGKNTELEEKAAELAAQKEEILQINNQLASTNEQLAVERKKSEEMLLNILPKETAKELRDKGSYTPRYYQMVSVLFTDFKGFTKIAEELSAERLIEELDYFFKYFDKVVEQHGLEKIKTIGDSYMCAGGIPQANYTNPIDTVLAALEIAAFSQKNNQKRIEEGRLPWELRIGINTGSLVAGVVGKKKFAYDIWGDAVNLASRMESGGVIGKVNISEHTYQEVKDFFTCIHRGKIFAKGKGDIDMYQVEGIRPELSLDGDGFSPNAEFRTMIKKRFMRVKGS